MGKLTELAAAFFGQPIDDDEARSSVIDLLEIASEREKIRPSMVLPCEDPPIADVVYTVNQQSYLIDAEQFV